MVQCGVKKVVIFALQKKKLNKKVNLLLVSQACGFIVATSQLTDVIRGYSRNT